MNFIEKLTHEQLQELQNFTESKKHSDKEKLKAKAILLVEAKTPAHVIKLMTKLTRRAAVEHRKRYIKNGLNALILKKRDREVPSFLTRNQKNELIEVLNTKVPSDVWRDAPSAWTAYYLSRYILENYSIKYGSKTSLYLIFTKASLIFRKPEKWEKKKMKECEDKICTYHKKSLVTFNSNRENKKKVSYD